MYCLEVIKSKGFQSPAKIVGNHKRDSSFCESRSGYVIHSGIHRSTAFISKVDHQDASFAFQYWSKQGQDAVNGFVESAINCEDLALWEESAFIRSRPGWTVRQVKGTGTNLGNLELIATRASGALVESQSANSWRHLHHRTK